MPHLTLVYPCVGRFPETRYVRSWQMQPLSIGVLSALTPSGWDRTFCDDRLEPVDFNQKTDLAAISIESFTARRGYQIADEFRRRGVPVVLGGYHATLCSEEAQQHADSVCIGEAEGVWKGLLEDVTQGRLAKIYRSEQFPQLGGVMPDRTIFRGKNYLKLALVETGRGCPFKCKFCSITAFYQHTYRRRPIGEIVNEIQQLREKTIFFVDDNIVGDVHDAADLFRELKPLHIKWISQASVNMTRDEKLIDLAAESGCIGLLIGFESFDPDSLAFVGKSVNKPADYARAVGTLRRRRISIYGTFMFGLPGHSPATIDEAVCFARKQKIFLTAFNHVVPFPGTPLYREFETEGRLMYDRWWLNSAYRFGQAPYYPENMSPSQLEACCLEARKKFYRAGSILERGLDVKSNCRSLKMAAYFMGINLIMRRELKQKFGLPLGVQSSPKKQARHIETFFANTSDDAALTVQ